MIDTVRFTAAAVAVAILLILVQMVSSMNEDTGQKGRIKAFDDVLRMYGEQINSGADLKYAVEEAKRLAHSREFPREFAEYYIEILELLQSSGDPKVLHLEEDRLNVIITAASNQPGAKGELEYATSRRNILGAFIDAAADYAMQGLFHSREGEFNAPSPVSKESPKKKATRVEI